MFIEIAETPRVHAEFSARLVVDAPLPIWCVVQRVVSDQGIGVVIVVVDRDSKATIRRTPSHTAGYERAYGDRIEFPPVARVT
jgi:hypothetical protein